jgi:hypothetical protein
VERPEGLADKLPVMGASIQIQQNRLKLDQDLASLLLKCLPVPVNGCAISGLI